MKEIAKSKTGQGWPKWKENATRALLVVGVVAAYGLPLLFLQFSGVAASRLENEGVALWEEWSFGLVLLGPSLFTTSYLAMASQLPRAERWSVRLAAIVSSIFMLSLIYWLSTKMYVSVVLSFAGVLYSVAADVFTPDSFDGPRINGGPCVESTEGEGSIERVSKHEAAAVPVSLRPQGEASNVSIPLMLGGLLVVPLVAIILDARDLMVGNRRGASGNS